MSKATKKPEISVANSYKRIEDRWKRLSADAKMSSARSSINAVEGEINRLADEIAAVRKRGYVFGNSMENEAKQLRSRWNLEERAAKRILHNAEAQLKKYARDVERQLGVAEKRRDLHDDVDRKLDMLESEINDVASRVSESLSDMEEGVDKIQRTLHEATKLLDALDEASFELYPDEHAVAMRPVESFGRTKEQGILFVTDQRIIFESREKKTTKKRFFIPVKRELVAEVEWEAPIGAIEQLEAEDKGGFIGIGDQDMLTLTFADDAKDVPETVNLRFRKHSDNEEWADTLLPYVMSGEIGQEMVGGEEETADFDTSNLPTTCPNCHATLPKIYRGMHQVECEFCGTTVNIG